MIIENPDAFKSWLTSILEPLCDADPAALAKYVYALVKKDKPLEELRDGMLDQLDVFLQQETKPFVDMLFKALETNDYLKLMEKAQEVSPMVEQREPEKEPEVENHGENHSENHGETLAPNGASSPLAGVPRARSPHAGLAAPRHRYVVCRAPPPPLTHNPHNPHNPHPPREHTLVKVMPLTELLEEPVEPPRRRDRRENMRDDRRRRRSRSWERRARARRHPRDAERDDRRRPQSRSPSPRGRFRNRSPPAAVDRPNTRSSRSRSPVPVREREHERERLRPPREMDRDRMSRDREHRDRASRSRDRDRSRDRSRSHSMSPHHVREHPDHYKRRCRDFDEKGYCMRGDLCQWDHGADPVVLEDAALSSVLALPPPVQEYNPLTPDIWCGAPYPPYPPEHLPPPRELIPIPRIHDGPVLGAGPMGAPPRLPAPPKKNFDYNRLGRSAASRAASGLNCSLEVKKVPRGLNDIAHLNNHFGKFGKIVNIQVCFEGDPEGALITFSNHTEASVAYKSTEAVLNNRFIKVFWHNPENKQENMAPPNQQKPINPQAGSHNKVLINRENIKATADNKQQALQAEKAKEAKEALANGIDKKKEVRPVEKSKQVMEMHKRAQALLETQLQQQVLLIQRLEGSNVTGPQRQVLMEAINSAQEGIEKLRKELVAYNRTLKLMQANAKKPKSREEAQKEILDAELDMFTKQQEGQDVTDLQKRIAELRRQMAMQFPVHTVMHRPHSRGGRFNTTRYIRAPFVNQSVDHRPRALLVSGFEADEAAALSAHFAQFGEIARKELNPTVPELVVVYRARAHAELAAQQARHYNDRTLTITWVANPKAFSSAPRAASPRIDAPEPVKETETPAEAADALLRFDEEEDEDEERSWRR